MKDSNIKGFLALFAAAVLYSFYGVFIRVQAHSFSNYGQLLTRGSLALLMVLVIIAVKKNWRFPKQERRLLVLFGVVNTLYPLAMVVSTRHIKASNAVMMLYVGGIASAFLIGSLLFKEAVTKTKIASLAMALTGLGIFAYPFKLAGSTLLGVLAGLGAGVCDAVGNSLRKYITETPREILLATAVSVSVVMMSAALLLTAQPIVTHTIALPTYVVIVLHALGIVFTGYLLVYGFKNIDVNIGTVILASELFVSMVVNRICLHESPSTNELIGAVVIFGASILVAFSSTIRHRKKEPILIGDLE